MSNWNAFVRYPQLPSISVFFFFTATAPPAIYTLSLHDALPISATQPATPISTSSTRPVRNSVRSFCRSEEHTSELQSRVDLVCRLLLEKKKGAHVRYSRSGQKKNR